ncbi:MAG: Rpn family recombination-promoting nuclease/putative transposase [Atopobiaceae bacterium]
MGKIYPISNDQVFKHVFGNDVELCRRLVELSLNRPIERVEYVETQHESARVGAPGATYFDVLATTETGEVIDVEMQASRAQAVERRARVYLARITVDEWSQVRTVSSARDYGFVPRAAVVFICDYDPMRAGRRRYTFEMRCNETDDLLGDGTQIVYLNARGSGDEIDSDLAAFLSYVAGEDSAAQSSDFVRAVADRVVATNEDQAFMEGVMDLEQKLWESREDGIEQGREQGRQIERENIRRLFEALQKDGRESELPDIIVDPKLLDEELNRYGIN